MDIFHDRPQTLIDFLSRPVEQHAILGHFQTRHRHTAGIGGFGWSKEQFFIRLSSNKTIDQLKQMTEFSEILDSLAKIGLATTAEENDV